MMAGFGYGTIRIIQSLRNDDQQTGEQLANYLKAIVDPADEWRIQLNDEVYNRNDLFKELKDIQRDLRENRHVPIIQIETHGLLGERGLELASRDEVLWSELTPVLKEINELSQINLLVVFSACWGASFINAFQISGIAPAWGFIGPEKAKSPSALLSVWKEFYFRLLAGVSNDFERILNRASIEIFSKEKGFRFFHAELLFRWVFESYLDQWCSTKAIQQRANDLFREQVGRSGTDQELARIIRGLSDHKSHFERLKKEFFMLEKCPQNADRFTIQYRDLTPSTK